MSTLDNRRNGHALALPENDVLAQDLLHIQGQWQAEVGN